MSSTLKNNQAHLERKKAMKAVLSSDNFVILGNHKMRLRLYELMLTDWKRHSLSVVASSFGFCGYLAYHFNLHVWSEETFKLLLPELEEQRNGKFGAKFAYHYSDYGCSKIGRTDRRIALKGAISLIKKTHNL
jgi:hypothetical protein